MLYTPQSSITVLRSLHLQLLFTGTVTCYTAAAPHHSVAATAPHHNLLLHMAAAVPHSYSFSSLLIIFAAAAHHPRCSYHLHHFICCCWIDIYITILALPYFSKAFLIEINASEVGLGVILMQDEKPLAYFSHKLSLQAQAKSVYERELMAMVLAIRK